MSGKQKAAAPRKPAAKKFTPASALPFVKRFQQAMLDAGGELPKHGVDGLFGPETERAAARLLVEVKALRSASETLQADNAMLRGEVAAQRGMINRLSKLNDGLQSANIALFIFAVVTVLAASGFWVAMALGLV